MSYLQSSSQDLLNPYLKLGLTQNPFTAQSSDRIPNHLWLDRGYSAAPAAQSRMFIQLLGVRGAGKTSHMQKWRSHSKGPYQHYPPGPKRVKFPPIRIQTSSEILYWDEADRIPVLLLIPALLIASLQSRTIVVGTHKNLERLATLCGLRVKTVKIPPFDEAALMHWAQLKIKAVRIKQTACRLQIDEALARRVAIVSEGSWRTAATELHIWAAQVAKQTAA